MKLIFIIIGVLLFISGTCNAENITGADLYQAGLDAFHNQDYERAKDLFNQSSKTYASDGDSVSSHNALLKMKQASWILLEMVYNETVAREVISAGLPNLSSSESEQIFMPGQSIRIRSDGKDRYYFGIAGNAAYRNSTFMQEQSRIMNHSVFFDEVYPLIAEKQQFEGWYGNPHTFVAHNTLNLPRNLLPDEGILKVWLPLPVETESQNNITILKLEPEEYIKTGPITIGDLGEVYFEIPLDKMKSSFINITADYQFTTYERRFSIDTDNISPYDYSSDVYTRYTRSQSNIELTPEVTALAEKIVGREQNPYQQARLFYRYIITTYPYSTVPHTYLAASKTPESSYLLHTGFGDCGTQSMFFAALCRSVGIPARSAGGYQLAPGIAGPHFWAEFYLPGYGWIPADVTIAESADWAFNKTEDERNRFKEYFFGNMDPFRYTIQNDVDVPFTPDPGKDVILNMVHQAPTVLCNESWEDTELLGMGYRNITFREIHH